MVVVVGQSSLLPSALDAAVSMVEVLVYSYGNGAQLGNSHKHAIQAISLLAMCEKRFDAAVDLFFDLVDRFCARVRDAKNDDDAVESVYTDAYAMRMLQNYDQTFVKVFLSKQWLAHGGFNFDNPLQRIKGIRRDNGLQENLAMACVRSLSGRKNSNSIFGDSVKVLKIMQRRRTTSAFKSKMAPGYRNGVARISHDTAGASSVETSRSRSVDRPILDAELGVT